MDVVQHGVRRSPGQKLKLTCCCGCGETFRRYRNKVRGRSHFLNNKHRGDFTLRRNLESQCGPYAGLVANYLECAAKNRYRTLAHVRVGLFPFFRYLTETGVKSISCVRPTTITKFQHWGRQNGCRKAASDTSALSVFFQWLIAEERFDGEVPVTPSIHSKRNKARSGRPYSADELAEIRALLVERGNERLRAFFELAIESGMRKEELYRLRLRDLVLDTKTLKVGLPNKTMRERPAFFGDRASECIRAWLSVRNADLQHDLLFHNYLGGPLLYESVPSEFQRVLCRTYKGKVVNETGLASFSVHRLRHSLASVLSNNGADAATVMSCLGWVSPSSMAGYIRLSETSKMRSYCTAMATVHAQNAGGHQGEQITPEEFLQIVEEVKV